MNWDQLGARVALIGHEEKDGVETTVAVSPPAPAASN